MAKLISHWIWRRRRRRMVECAVCGKSLPVARAVIITGDITWDRDAGATTVAEYHRRCARRAGVGQQPSS